MPSAGQRAILTSWAWISAPSAHGISGWAGPACFSRRARSDLEERVVNALAWAGRATVEPRRDQAFLLYAISLESLLTKPGARAGVTDRLRLRVAHLIGREPATRQRVMALMSTLYDIRSALVHSGDSGALADIDLRTISELVERALTGILTDDRFTAMRDVREFDRWFDAQLLG